MKILQKFTAVAAVTIMVGASVAATPAAAWSRYYNNGGAVAGAAIGGMALGALLGAAASQPRYYGGYGYGYPPPPPPLPAYGYPPPPPPYYGY